MKKDLPFFVRNALKTKRKLRKAKRGQSRTRQLPRLGYSIKKFAELTGVSRSSVYKALRNGCLTARKIGKRTIIAPGMLENTFIACRSGRGWRRAIPENGIVSCAGDITEKIRRCSGRRSSGCKTRVFGAKGSARSTSIRKGPEGRT